MLNGRPCRTHTGSSAWPNRRRTSCKRRSSVCEHNRPEHTAAEPELPCATALCHQAPLHPMRSSERCRFRVSGTGFHFFSAASARPIDRIWYRFASSPSLPGGLEAPESPTNLLCKPQQVFKFPLDDGFVDRQIKIAILVDCDVSEAFQPGEATGKTLVQDAFSPPHSSCVTDARFLKLREQVPNLEPVKHITRQRFGHTGAD